MTGRRLSRSAVRPRSPVWTGISDLVESVRGVTPWPLVFRSSMVVFAVGAGVLAAIGRAAPLLVLAAALLTFVLAAAGAVFPASAIPLMVQVALLGEVVVTRGSDPAAWVADGVAVAGVTCLAYLHHLSAAMAAALPWQAVPRPGALAAFARRTGAVIGGTLTVAIAVLALAGGVHGSGPSLLSLVGLVLAAAVGLVPALLFRRTS